MVGAEPSNNLRRLTIGVTVIVVAAVAAVLLLRRPADAPAPPAPVVATTPAPSEPGRPEGPPAEPAAAVLSRADLLAAAGAGAAAYAEGRALPAEAAALAGRRFMLRIPFGCGGPQAPRPDSSASWEVGPGGETLRVRVRPEVWTESPFAQSLAGPDVEAVEGYWIPRPWQGSETCPARLDDPLLAEAAAPSPQTVGVATVFGSDSSRLGRRGERPYELTLPLAEAGRPGAQGLQLVLEGRVAPFAGAETVACRSASPDQRPVCLIGVVIERAAVRDPASERLLGEWRDASSLAAPPPSSPAGSAGAARPG